MGALVKRMVCELSQECQRNKKPRVQRRRTIECVQRELMLVNRYSSARIGIGNVSGTRNRERVCFFYH
jgi:hypothetical protein